MLRHLFFSKTCAVNAKTVQHFLHSQPLWRPKANFQSLRVCSWCWPWLQKSAEEGQLDSAEVILCSILAVGACLCKETCLTCLDVAQMLPAATGLEVSARLFFWQMDSWQWQEMGLT